MRRRATTPAPETGAPAPHERPGWVDDELYPFTSRFLDVDGHVVHHVDEGRGPVLLMLHGNPTWSFLHRRAIAGLRTDHRCIAVDLPGFGLSTAAPGYTSTPEEHAEVVRALVTRLDLHDVTLVTHDWGGPIGLDAATRDPDRYARVVVANTWAWPLRGGLRLEVFSRLMGGPLGRFLVRRFNLFVTAGIPRGHHRRRPDEAEMQHYRDALGTPERRLGSSVLPGAFVRSRPFLRELAGRLHVLADLPTLVVWGDRDADLGEPELERWRRLRPTADVVVLHDVGHYLQSDAPEEYLAALRGWLRATG
ncbi:alpha/beta fold hydrolase [Pseudokineococcus basanitobsidens]|uniref:Alpha/beta fold hydrolase n=1 Tax=Pseudokineococcus basanitobsidens TaxID=1926649 RepID=A0ABU8RFT9_9ACTN